MQRRSIISARRRRGCFPRPVAPVFSRRKHGICSQRLIAHQRPHSAHQPHRREKEHHANQCVNHQRLRNAASQQTSQSVSQQPVNPPPNLIPHLTPPGIALRLVKFPLLQNFLQTRLRIRAIFLRSCFSRPRRLGAQTFHPRSRLQPNFLQIARTLPFSREWVRNPLRRHFIVLLTSLHNPSARQRFPQRVHSCRMRRQIRKRLCNSVELVFVFCKRQSLLRRGIICARTRNARKHSHD